MRQVFVESLVYQYIIPAYATPQTTSLLLKGYRHTQSIPSSLFIVLAISVLVPTVALRLSKIMMVERWDYLLLARALLFAGAKVTNRT